MDTNAAVLDQTQKRLHQHFRTIAATRENSGFPVFALEHGLSPREFEQLAPLLQHRLKNRLPLTRHWLLWAVYSAEIGYGYTGDEYWPSFEEQTPGWGFNDRPKVKTWFRKFRQTYGGVIPTGHWAEQFTIIAWPITHAIVPRCLQWQFARALYDLRFRLASRSHLDANTIGRLLAVNASQGSTRFQAFLQQEGLTGHIVFALLGAEPSNSEELLHAPTLRRIVNDLEKVRRTREWLKETRRIVADRFRGIGRGSGPPLPRPGHGPSAPPVPDTSHLSLRPTLMLRHAGAGNWAPVLEVKSFRGLAALSADLQSFLRRTRCRLNGANDMKPAGWLLSGNRKGILRSWPDAARPLIEFERRHPIMDHLMDSECRLSHGPLWLFRIASDGTAREITGRVVRPGNDYIVATTGDLPRALEGADTYNLQCAGAESCRLAVPHQVSADMTAQLSTLGLQVARTIDVWPAGLPGRSWDGEGHSEWLTTEAPCFGIAYDHPVDGFEIRLDDATDAFIQSNSDYGPLFVRLPPLPAGAHLLTVKARRSSPLDSVAQTPPAEGFAQLAVRDPEPWTPGVTSHPGLIVTADPPDSSLDTFWTNRLSLSVNGPVGFQATFAVDLETADGRTILAEPVGSPIALPVTPRQWHDRFDDFIQNDARIWKYLEAASCTLTIRGDTLGTCTLRFEHEPLPMRWLMRSNRSDIVVRLVDESEQDEYPTRVRFYGIESPSEPVSIDPQAARSGIVVTPPGGLFVASHGRHADAVVVSTPSTTQGLQGLGVTPRIDDLPKDAKALSTSFRLLRSWHDARLSGFLVHLRRRQVTTEFLEAVFRALGGKNWADAEADFRKRPPQSRSAMRTFAMHVDKRSNFGPALLQLPEARPDTPQLKRWFTEAASRAGVCRDTRLSDVSLRLASQPFAAIADPEFDTLVGRLADNPAVFRGARFLTLTGEVSKREPSVPPPSRQTS